MATVFSTPTAPLPKQLIATLSRRSTYKGVQYVVEDIYTTEVVVVNGTKTTCSCRMLEDYAIACQHILHVNREESAYAVEAQTREAHCTAFALYE